VEEPKRPVVGLAQSPGRLGHLLENRLQPGGACDSAENAADRALLLPRVLEFTGEVRAVPRDASQSFSLGARVFIANDGSRSPPRSRARRGTRARARRRSGRPAEGRC
jgi:hypothetical protein